MFRGSRASRAFSSAASIPPSTNCSTTKIARANDPDEKARLDALKGKIAIANAKLAYQRYMRLFAGERWQALAAKGAKPQRLLWASTGTKNKAYSDVLYVEELIGPDTVNTMPVATMDAFRDHGKLRDSLEENPAERAAQLDDLGRAGISLDAVTDKLVEDGVQLFADAADKLLARGRQETNRNPRASRSTGKSSRSAHQLAKKAERNRRGMAHARQYPKTLAARQIAVDRMPTKIAGSAGWTASATTRSRATPPLRKRSKREGFKDARPPRHGRLQPRP